jgi:hypothetical protein
MVPASPLRIRRIKLGLSLWQVALAIGSDAISVSLLERNLARRSALRSRLLAFYREHEQAGARRPARRARVARGSHA